MLLISDLDELTPDEAQKIRKIAEEVALSFGRPYDLALDYVLINIDRKMSALTNGMKDENNPK